MRLPWRRAMTIPDAWAEEERVGKVIISAIETVDEMTARYAADAELIGELQDLRLILMEGRPSDHRSGRR